MSDKTTDDDFVRRDPDYPNLIDGTIYVTDARPGGVYVTVAGNDEETPTIVAFDWEDLGHLRNLSEEVFQAAAQETSEPDDIDPCTRRPRLRVVADPDRGEVIAAKLAMLGPNDES